MELLEKSQRLNPGLQGRGNRVGFECYNYLEVAKGWYPQGIGSTGTFGQTRVKDQFFDPRNASPKPFEARGLHPMGAPRGASRSGSATTIDIYKEHRRTSFGITNSTRPSGARGLDGDRSMYLPTEWGPQTRETTLLSDSATTTRRTGLGCAQRGSLED